jgi:hypothetical protein
MTDYAMIRYETNTVRRVVKDIKPHKNAYTVIYPTISETDLTHIISLNPINLWEVDNTNKEVTATYSIIPKDFNNEKNKVLEKIRQTRKDLSDNTILTLQYETDIIFTTKTDRKTRDDIKDISQQFRDGIRQEVNWEYEPHQWVLIDLNIAEFIWESIIDYRDLVFSKQFELEDQINNLDNDFQELKNINDGFYNYFKEN